MVLYPAVASGATTLPATTLVIGNTIFGCGLGMVGAMAAYGFGALYDKLHISHDGYAGAVPIVHKSAAVSEVIAQLAIEADEDPE